MICQRLVNDLIADMMRPFLVEINTTKSHYLDGNFQLKLDNGITIHGRLYDQLLIIYHQGIHTFKINFSSYWQSISISINGDGFEMKICGLVKNLGSICLLNGSIKLNLDNMIKKLPFQLAFYSKQN